MPFKFKAERLCGAAAVGAPERRAFLRCPGYGRGIPKGARKNSPYKQVPHEAGMGVRWLWGALSVLVLWTVLDRETVIEKDIRAFELRSVEIMDTTGLSLLPSGWHPSLPARCADHGGKQGPCPLGFCKGCPCSATGCTLRHGLGPGLKGKTAVKKGAEPEKVLPFRVPEPPEGGYVERNEGDFCEAVSSDTCKPEDVGALLGIKFRLREAVPDAKIFNAR